ncbi:unnamed protein product [Alopecurus aequalis]
MAPSSDPPPWSDLPHHILGLVIDRLSSSPAATVPRRHTFWSACSQLLWGNLDEDTDHFRSAYRSHHTDAAADCARLRAVCRSWRAAVREHLPRPPRRLPWTVLCDGYFMTGISGDHGDTRRLPSWPTNATCMGATDDWLAVQYAAEDDGGGHTYSLHNPFSNKTVPLPEIDAIIGNSSSSLEVRKVLMRSSPHDIVAFLTNNYNHPLILARPGKGVWLPRPRSAPFIYIIDIVFVGDKLYGITNAEDLISLDISFDGDGKPTVTWTERVIRHEPKTGDLSLVWGDADFNRVPTNILPLDDAYDLWSDVDEKYRQDDNVKPKRRPKNNLRGGCQCCYNLQLHRMKDTGDGTISKATQYNKTNNGIVATTWHIIDSLGKLLMVKRKCQWDGMNFTRWADVLEANTTTGAWMPVTTGLDGRALFISGFYCKSIYACGEVEKDAIYVVDRGDVLNLKSRINSQPRRKLYFTSSMWIFPPEIVV